MNEIKPCPFCGQQASLEEEWGPFYKSKSYRIECPTSDLYCCKPSTRWQSTPQDAIDLWNKRN
jgi:Lar family restriction alleviation protein